MVRVRTEAARRMSRTSSSSARGEATRANEILVAAKPLYATLSDDQKKTADELLTRGDRHAPHFGRFR